MKKITTVLILMSNLLMPSANGEDSQPLELTVLGQVALESSLDDSTPLKTISKAQLNASGATTVIDALRKSGLVNLGTTYTGNGRDNVVSIGGYGENSAQNTLILLDGQPLNFGTLETVDLGTIPLSSVDKIEVISAGAGVQFGEGATGGVINIVTQRPETNSASIETKFGSNNLRGSNGHLTQQISRSTFLDFSFDRELNDNERSNNKSSIKQANLALRGSSKSAAWEYRFRINDSDQELPGSIEYPTTDKSSKNYQVHAANLQLSLPSSTQLSFNIADARSQNTTIYTSYGPYSTLTSKRTGKLELTKSFEAVDMEMGAEQSKDRYGYSAPTTQAISSIYSRLNIHVNKQIQTSVGVRSLKVEDKLSAGNKESDAVNTMASLSYDVTPSLTLFSRYDESTRFATLDESGSSSQPSYLNPQHNLSKLIGVRSNLSQLNWELVYNRVKIIDEIYYDATLSCGWFGCNVNLPSSERETLAFSLDGALSETTRAGTTITLARAKFTSGSYQGKSIPWVPRERASLYIFHRLNQPLSLYLNTTYTGAMYLSDDYSNASRKAPDYWIKDVSLNYETGPWGIGFEIKNLEDKDYSAFATTSATYPASGRTLAVRLRYDF